MPSRRWQKDSFRRLTWSKLRIHHRTTTTKQLREHIADFLNISLVDHHDEIEKAINNAINELFLENEEEEQKHKSNKMSRVKEQPGGKSKIEAHLDRLKSYVFKCGVRKVWKKELEDLNTTQSISKVNKILEDLGMEGRPTLQKCKNIKERREYEKELEVIDKSNIIDSKRRSRSISKLRDNESRADSFDYLSRLGDPKA